MNEKFREYIREFGGKQGPLEYLRDHDPVLSQFIPEAVKFRVSEGYSKKISSDVARMCEAAGTEEVIVRASVRGKTPDDLGDFDGIVDKVASVKTSLGSVEHAVEKVLKSIFKPELLASIQAEGKDFVPEDTLIAISPKNFNNWAYTLTENPNRAGVFYDDGDLKSRMDRRLSPFTLDGNDYYNVGGGFGSGAGISLMNTGPKRLVKFTNERARLLIPNQALQFEYGNTEDHDLNLFQVKALGPRNHAERFLPYSESKYADLIQSDRTIFAAEGLSEEKIEEEIQDLYGDIIASEKLNAHHTRLMGATSPEGVELTICEALDRRDFLDFEKNNPGVPYLGMLNYISSYEADPPLQLDEQTQNMIAYFSSASFERLALIHQHTRFVMDALKRGGVAAIGEEVNIPVGHGKKVRLKSDGWNYQIDAL